MNMEYKEQYERIAKDRSYNLASLKTGKFYQVHGEIMLHSDVVDRRNGSKEYHFSSKRMCGSTVLRVYNSWNDEFNAFMRVLNVCKERILLDGNRLCDGERLERIAKFEVDDQDEIRQWYKDEMRTANAISGFYERNPQLNHE